MTRTSELWGKQNRDIAILIHDICTSNFVFFSESKVSLRSSGAPERFPKLAEDHKTHRNRSSSTYAEGVDHNVLTK